MVRRVNSRRGEVDRSPSVMTSNTGTGRRGHSGGDPRGEPRGAEVDRSPSVMQSSGGLRERFAYLVQLIEHRILHPNILFVYFLSIFSR